MSELMRFDGRVAVVTGAGRGLGRAHALLLAARGARVVVNDLGARLGGGGSDDSPAAAVVAEIEAAGGEAIADDSDVSTAEGAACLVGATMAAWGRIDAVVNNAGILAPNPFPEVTRDELDRHFAVHVGGSFEVTRAAWPALTASGAGRVVMTTSSALFGAEHLVAYSVAKAALVGLGRALAASAPAAGIKVNLLAPAAETRMVTDPGVRASSGLPPLAEGAGPSAGRGPDEVAPMCALLAHERCPVNGEIVAAGAGRLARIVLAETPGIVSPGLTLEGILERWPQIAAEEGYVVPRSTAESVRFREALVGNA